MFTAKTIRLTITLGKGTFRGGGNTIIINDDVQEARGDYGLAVALTVEKPGLPEKNSARVRVIGLSLETMSQLTTLGFRALTNRKNIIQIEAGEQGKTLSTIFTGEITFATADFNGAPDIPFDIQASSGSLPAITPAKPMSVQGTITCEKLIKQWAAEIGYSVKNEGVTSSVKNCVFNGTVIEKAQALSEQVGFELLIDDTTFVMLPQGKSRSGATPLLSAETGLIGYPTFTEDGIKAKCEFAPDIQQGGGVEIKSSLPYASGLWKVTKVTHTLTAFVDGAWQTEISGTWTGEDRIWKSTKATEN